MKHFILLMLLLASISCIHKKEKQKTREDLKKDSLYMDSVRCEVCDSIRFWLRKKKMGINISDSAPENLDQCIAQLDTLANDTIKLWFRCLTDREYIESLHLDFGMYMRNHWGLWWHSDLALYFNTIGIFHPDDMSGIILMSFKRKLEGKKYDLQKQIKNTRNYWDISDKKFDSLVRDSKEKLALRKKLKNKK